MYLPQIDCDHIDSTVPSLQVVAHGSYHSEEGIQLEKFSLEAGMPLSAHDHCNGCVHDTARI